MRARASIWLSQRLPALPGAGLLAAWLIRLAGDMEGRVRVRIRGVSLELDLGDHLERCYAFKPHLFDRREIAFATSRLPSDGIFIDGGAHLGLYAAAASRALGRGGRVIAVEADPVTAQRLSSSLREAGCENVSVVNAGIAAIGGHRMLRRNVSGNRGASSFVFPESEDTVDVRTLSLVELCAEAGLHRIDALKLDLEGMEHEVLTAFFSSAPRVLYPRRLVLEFHSWLVAKTGDPVKLAIEHGYRLHARHDYNYMLELPQD